MIILHNSIAKVLGAVAPKGEVQATKLYNLMDGRKDGTYRYRGDGEYLTN